MSNASALEVRALRAGWGRRDILQAVSLAVSPGERLAVLGPNGSGKTTLFDVISGRLRPRAGNVLLHGEEVVGLPLHRRARLGLGYVPQEPTAFPDLTVRANLEVAVCSPAGSRNGRRPSISELAVQVDESLNRWRLSGLQNRLAGVLSGGERRRLEVARALLARPSVVLLDEPFAGLDPDGRDALCDGIQKVGSEVSLLITDHAVQDVVSVCDRLLLLFDGRLVFDGVAEELDARFERYFGQAGLEAVRVMHQSGQNQRQL